MREPLIQSKERRRIQLDADTLEYGVVMILEEFQKDARGFGKELHHNAEEVIEFVTRVWDTSFIDICYVAV
ncbi:MAG: hypothetical protein JRJ20_15370 [Deltaproteobacteria bacterium]|nr:hypothetical protein [Deltaproteobacteria bacterium]